MPYVRAVVKPKTSKSLPSKFNRYPQKERLFKFSSILSARYPHGRVAPSTVPSTSSEWDNTFTDSVNSINIEENKPTTRNQTTSITDLPQTPEAKKKRRVAHYSRVRCIKVYMCILCAIFFLIGIGILVFAILYRPRVSSYTTSTTSTTTTYTSATTSTSTTSTTTSISTTSTSTTETTSTSTSTTSDTTITTTTDTTTTTACYFGDDYAHLVDGGQRQIKNLQVGDRVWGLSDNGQQLVEDEIMCIPHAGPNTLTEFYTFITTDGHRISVTDRHYLIVSSNDSNKPTIKSASSITLDDQLILINRSVALEQIFYSKRLGYYSPITLSGYLLVNNISTSVYSELFSGTHEFFYQLTGPARVYYHITRWLFGKDYIPFVTSVNEELHPISVFIIDNYDTIQLIFNNIFHVVPAVFIGFNIYMIQRLFFPKKVKITM